MVNCNIENITLIRGNNGMGFNIRGGNDNQIMKGENGIYVFSIRLNGSVYKQGKLKQFDKILEVNGVNVENVSHHFVLDIFHKNKVCQVKVDHTSFNRMMIQCEGREDCFESTLLKSMQANGGDYSRTPRAAVEEEDMEDEGIIEDYDTSSPVPPGTNLPMLLYSLGFVSVLFIIGVKVTVSVCHK